MRQLPFIFLFMCLGLSSCKNRPVITKDKTNKMTVEKGECYISPDESFDSTFVINGGRTRLKCITECYGDYIVDDTINNSNIVSYKNRRFVFTLENPKIDTNIVITKELIKESYGNNETFKRSVISFPKIDSYDSIMNSIIINSFFVYPRGLYGTDYFETIVFEITFDGKVNLIKIIPYQEPEI